MLQLISLLVENKPGALMRVAGVLTSRGYNIESLTVAKTVDPTLSIMTIAAEVGDNGRELLIKQISRLVNVIKAVDLTASRAVQRELVLIKIRVEESRRPALLTEVAVFNGRVVDASPTDYMIEATGSPRKIEDLINVVRSYGPIEMVRSGAMAMARSKRNKLPVPQPGETSLADGEPA